MLLSSDPLPLADPTPPPAGLKPELRGRMWADLFTTELAARSAQHVVTGRALTYLTCGLPLDQVLDALKLDAEGWEARVASHAAWTAENRAAGARLSIRRVEEQDS